MLLHFEYQTPIPELQGQTSRLHCPGKLNNIVIKILNRYIYIKGNDITYCKLV